MKSRWLLVGLGATLILAACSKDKAESKSIETEPKQAVHEPSVDPGAAPAPVGEKEKIRGMLLEARKLYNNGDFAGAEAIVREALKLSPDLGEAQVDLARMLSRQGKGDEASAAMARALTLAPEDTFAMLNFGFILADQGKVAEGVEQLRKAVALKPQQARLLCGLVQLLGKSKAEGAAEELAAARKQVEGAGANCQRERNPLDGYGDVKE